MEWKNQIRKFIDLYYKLKEIEVAIYDIEVEHKTAKHFKIQLEKAISELDHAAHILYHEAYILKLNEGKMK